MQNRRDYENEAPKSSDSLGPGPLKPDPISSSPAGQLLNNFLETFGAFGDEAQEKYDVALKELREHAEDVVTEIARSSRSCGDEDYPLRWSLIHTASELRHPAALPFLRNQVMTPIPQEQSKDPHSFSTVAEETVIRTTAVQGVEYLASEGNEDAKEALFQFIKVPSLSIRRAAVQAILATMDNKMARRQLASLLPADQHFLLDIKRVDVQDVEQIKEPERHLSDRGREAVTEPPPRISGEQEGKTPKAYK